MPEFIQVLSPVLYILVLVLIAQSDSYRNVGSAY